MVARDSAAQPSSWRLNALLLFIGCFLGTILVYAAWSVFLKPRAGSQFESITDLRASMIGEDLPSSDQESVPLRNLIYPHPSDQIIYDLRPNLNLRFQRAQVRTNSCGMRGPEYSMVKPPNTYRIALLGDSFAFGWGVEEQQTFAAQMERALNRTNLGSTKFEVLNLGVPGYSTFQELGLDFSPDAVVVFFVENDYGPPFFIREMGSGSQIQTLNRFMSLGVDPVERQKHLENLARIDPNKALRRLADIGKERGIPVYLAINPKKAWVDDRKKLWILRQRKDIRLMNIYDQFMDVVKMRSIDAKDLTLSFDPHPSPLKHEILGLVMAQYFLEFSRP